MHLLKRIPEIVLYIVLGVALSASLFFNQTAREAQQEDIQNRTGYPPAVSQESPLFTVNELAGGEELSSDTFWGNGSTLIVFCFPDCPYLSDVLEVISSSNVPAERVRVVFTDIKKGDENIIEKYDSDYPDILFYTESGHSATWAYNIRSTPYIYIYDETGVIRYRSLGSVDSESDGDMTTQKWVELIKRQAI